MKAFKNKLIGGALALTISGVITKLIGAFYRVPLTNVLGAEGMGVYQMIFPFYTILLTLSSTGAPSGISKLIASGGEPEQALKSSLKLFSALGLIGTLIMAVLAFPIASLQGNSRAWICYLFLSPSVFLVSVISSYRGYFQGLVNMKPTGISQVIEQAVKLVLGLGLAYLVKGSIELRAGVCALAVTLSETVALAYVAILYNKTPKTSVEKVSVDVKTTAKIVIPIMLASLVMPVIRTIDSFLILNLVKAEATKSFGLYSGVVESLVSVPVTVCYSLSVTSIPIIAGEKTMGNKCKKAFNAIGLTAVLAVLCAVVTFFASTLIINLLYSGLTAQEKQIAITMLKISALSVTFLPIMQALIAAVNAMGKTKVSIISLSASGVVKIVASIILLPIPEIGVFGAIYSDILCYFVACFSILGYIIYIKLKETRKGKNNEQNNRYRSWRHVKRFIGGG